MSAVTYEERVNFWTRVLAGKCSYSDFRTYVTRIVGGDRFLGLLNWELAVNVQQRKPDVRVTNRTAFTKSIRYSSPEDADVIEALVAMKALRSDT